ncbi:hypothetical protein [Leifsonia sp. P73]|uniref:hypothetical protein n=1 Tax=Leifsonia sp. P73 TaxID=3423959 RepID=UPI003DA55DDC
MELDHNSKWALHKIDRSDHERLLKKLGKIEAMTPAQAIANHVLSKLDMGDCPNKNAAARLANQYEGLDVLHELRVEPSQDGRLLGRLEKNVFNIIWWDAKHEVWPSQNRR